MSLLTAWGLALGIGIGLYALLKLYGANRKPCGCHADVGGEPWKKRLNSEMKTHRGGGYRVDYVETARECAGCGEVNVVRQAWSAAKSLRSPHPVWHEYKKDGVESDYTDEYKEAHTWTDPGNVDSICRWDYGDDPHYIEWESWDGDE